MQCLNHSDRRALAVCQKYARGYCRECCECLNIDNCCECADKKLYCRYRSQCLVWELSRDRRKQDVG